jgi:preprotein translocase subunit SecG
MRFFVGILTVLLVINCLLLIFLVLIQLPKKEAGVGVAFGGAAADALFGAGSGNFLTQATKYATVIFFLMALSLGYLGDRLQSGGGGSGFEKEMEQKQMHSPIIPPPAALSVPQPAVAPTNNLLLPPVSAPVSVPAGPTNPPAAPTQSK